MKDKYVYHWTHRKNLRSVLRKGLDPAYALGMLPAVWVCDEKNLGWALAHVSSHHGWNANDIVCIRIHRKNLPLKRTAIVGVYNVRGVIPACEINAVLLSIGSVWVPTNTRTKRKGK